MSWTLCSSYAAIVMAGKQANSSIVASAARLAEWSDNAESIICATARKDIITAFTTMTASGKYVVQEIAAALVAEQIIGYDVSGDTERAAEFKTDILENKIRRGLALISDDKARAYLGL